MHVLARVRGLVLVIALALAVAAPASAGTYDVDPLLSSVDLVLDISVFGVPLSAPEQFPGSLSTSYGGTVEMTPLDSSLGFPGGGSADADLQPLNVSPLPGGGAGSAPGDYGVLVDETVDVVVPPFDIPGFGPIDIGTLHTVFFEVAGRDVVLDVNSLGVQIPLAGGAFDASQLDFDFFGGVDIRANVIITPGPGFVVCAALGVFAPTLEADFAEFGLQLDTNCPLFGASTVTVDVAFNQPLDGSIPLLNQETGGLLSVLGGVAEVTIPVGLSLTLADLGDIPPEFQDIVDLSFGLEGTLVAAALTECSNGLDDDTDGSVDNGADPGCDSSDDISEHSDLLLCDNGIDDDGDGFIDFRIDAATDIGCKNSTWIKEDPQCSDGINNDGDQDIFIDFDGGVSAGLPPGEITAPDPQCMGPSGFVAWKNKERVGGCGLGAELALLVAPFLAMRRRRRA